MLMKLNASFCVDRNMQERLGTGEQAKNIEKYEKYYVCVDGAKNSKTHDVRVVVWKNSKCYIL